MSLDGMKSMLLNELFFVGRAWTESVLDVSEVVPSEVTATADELASYGRFSVQVAREFEAVSTDLLQEGGSLGAPVSYIQDVGNNFLMDRYSGAASFGDWRLWLDSSLRSSLVGEFRSAYSSGKSALDAVSGMVDLLSIQPAIMEPEPASSSTLFSTREIFGDDVPMVSASANIGSFGPVGFEVSNREIFTLNEMSRKREAGFAEHKVINGKTRLQFTGIGLWEVPIKVLLSRNWTDPEKRIAQLDDVQVSGEHYPLVVGGKNFGMFVLVSYSEDVSTFGRSGEIETASLSLTFKEYSDAGKSVVQVSRVRSSRPAPVRKPAPVKKLTVSSYGGR